MRVPFLPVACVIVILSLTLFSGCVAPPKDVAPSTTTVTQGSGGYSSGTANTNAGQTNPGNDDPGISY